MSAALALAEDSKLIAAAGGNADPQIDRDIVEARQRAENADAEFRQAANTFANGSAFEGGLFFGAFVFGVARLLFAVGSVQ